MTDLLAAELAAAEQQAAHLRAQVEAEQQASQQRAAAAQQQWDSEFLASWQATKDRLQTDMAAAEEEFRKAVLADPIYQAYIRWRATRVRLMAVHRDALNVANGNGTPNLGPGHEMSWRFPEFLDAVLPVLEREASNLGERDSEDRWEARAQTIEAAKKGNA